MPEQQNIRDLKITNTNDTDNPDMMQIDADDKDKPLINYYYEILTQEAAQIFMVKKLLRLMKIIQSVIL